jgi:hypothetical protein
MKFGVIFILVLAFFSIEKSHAQKPPKKFGDVSLEELKMTVYEKDSSADAVVLFDYGVCEVQWATSDNNWMVELTHTKRLKLLNKNGYEHSNYSVSLYTPGSEDETISNIKAVTYTLENNKIVETKLDKETISKIKLDEDWTEVKIALPNIKEGSILEFTYTISSSYVAFLRSWTFQDEIPVIWSEFWVKYPEYFDYTQFAQGYEHFHIQEKKFERSSFRYSYRDMPSGTNGIGQKQEGDVDYERICFHWVSKDVPAFKDEKYITSINDHIVKVDFQLNTFKWPYSMAKSFYKGWDGLCKDLMDAEYFGGYINKRAGVKSVVEEVIKDKTNNNDKILALYQYILENVRWNGDRSIYTDHSPKEILTELKKGNSAEINLLYINMLKEAGIEVHPVVLSTRKHGKINQIYPNLRKLNHVIAYIALEDKYFLVDATDPMRSINMLDYQDLNGSALIVKDKGAFEWINLETSDKSKTTKFCILNIDESGVIEGDMQITSSGYNGLIYKKVLLENKDKSPFKLQLDSEKMTFSDEKVENLNSITEPLKCTSKIKSTDHVIMTGERIYLDPFLEIVSKTNPFKKEERKFPIDFGFPYQENITLSYKLPSNYVIEEMPKSIQMSLPENTGSFKYNAVLNGNQLQFNFTLNINKSVFQPEEYGAVRQIYEEMSKKLQEQVVLKKVSQE